MILQTSLAILCLIKLCFCSVYYKVNYNEAYTWNRAYPQGCECAESQTTKQNCELFKCQCLCDLTAGICDYNCCCDPDCSSDQISRFDELKNGCEYEGGEPNNIELCYSSVELYGVNPKSPMGGQSTSQAAVGQALCVEKVNTLFKSDFYTDDTVVSSSVFDTSSGQKEYSYMETSTVSTLVDSSYDKNDSISAFLNTTVSGLVSNGPGYFQIPLPDFTGYCNDQNYITFENNVKPTQCSRLLSKESSLFISQCEEQYSISRFVSKLFIGSSSTIQATSGSPSYSDLTGISINKIYFEDFINSTIVSDITNAWKTNNCYTRGYSNLTTSSQSLNNSKCSFSTQDTLNFILQNSNTMCQGLIKSVNYIITHASTTNADITSVTATVTISDIPMTLQDTATSTETSVTITQIFSVGFASVGSTPTKNDGNLVTRLRSGNPGYVMGLPVLYGFLDSSYDVMEELVVGFTVPSSFAPYNPDFPRLFGKSICPTSSNTRGESQVQFGYDLVSGCILELTRDELINMCCASGSGTCTGSSSSYSSPYSNSMGIPYFLEFTQGYIGNYGDADPLDPTQWTEITYSEPSDTRQWNAQTVTCNNMYTGLNIQFLIGWSGEKNDPQNKIISSLVQLTTSNLVMDIPADDDVSTQTFPLTITVSFIFQSDEQSTGYVPPAPPVLFEVPYDVFYPFIGNAQTSDGISNKILFSNLIYYILISILLVTISLFI